MIVEITKENINKYIDEITGLAWDGAFYIRDVLDSFDPLKYFDEAEIVTIGHMWDIACSEENGDTHKAEVDCIDECVYRLIWVAHTLGLISNKDALLIQKKYGDLMSYSFSYHSYDKWLSDFEHCMRNVYDNIEK